MVVYGSVFIILFSNKILQNVQILARSPFPIFFALDNGDQSLKDFLRQRMFLTIRQTFAFSQPHLHHRTHQKLVYVVAHACRSEEFK